MTNAFLDEAGERVVHFAADVRTLGKLGELSAKIIQMAESGAWRRYRTAVGTDSWRECEFDYFLIACDLAHDDVYRAIKWHKLGEQTRAMMDENAEPKKRRTLEQAAAKWHAPGPETLVERAGRLGWTKNDGTVKSPLSKRQRSKQATGKAWEAQAQERRRQRLTAKRRSEIDRLAATTFSGLGSDDERRYLLDTLRALLAPKAGRPQGDHEQWARDIAELDGDTKALAERWGITQRGAQLRAKETREFSSPVAS